MKRRKELLCIYCLALGLCACQAAPSSEVIANKGDGVLESKIQAQGSGADEETDTTEDHWTEEFTGNSGVTVTVDADVPEEQVRTVLRVVPHEITADELKTWMKAVGGEDAVAYEPVTELSKSELEEKILQIRKSLEDGSLDEEYGDDEENKQSAREAREEKLAAYEKLYESAPEKVEQKESDWTFHSENYYSEVSTGDEDSSVLDTMELQVEFQDGEGSWWQLSGTNRDEEDYMLHNISLWQKDDAIGDGQADQSAKGSDGAMSLAEETLRALSLDGEWKAADCQEMEDYYKVECRKSYNGVTGAVLPQLSAITGTDGYAALYYYETLELSIKNDQIQEIWYMGATDVKETEAENVETLSFEEIKERVRTQMLVTYSDTDPDGEGGTGTRTLEIRRIENSLVRIKIPDNEKEFRMVPAWIFWGSDSGYNYESPLLVINAVDGTVINTELGY